MIFIFHLLLILVPFSSSIFTERGPEMIFCLDVKDRKTLARPVGGPQPGGGLGPPLGGGLVHPFDVADLQGGGVGLLGGGKDTLHFLIYFVTY